MRRSLACAASLVLVAFLLTGCGRTDSVPAAGPAASPTTGPAPAAPAEPAVAPAAAPAMGTLDVGDVGAQLRLVSEAGKTELEGNSGRWALAPGTYRAETIILSRRDKDGNDWHIFGSAKDMADGAGAPSTSVAALGRFQIAAGQVTHLKLGPPIILAAPMEVKDGEAKIVLQLTGQGGEKYCAAAVLNENLRGAPNIKISNELGEELESGQFRYG